MPSHLHKHPLSGVVRWAVPAALCSAGMMGAWLAPGASAVASTAASTAAASTPAARPAVVVHRAAKAPSAKAVLAYWTPARLRAAKPASVTIAGTKPKAVPATGQQPGQPGQVAGGRPNGHAAVFPVHQDNLAGGVPLSVPLRQFHPVLEPVAHLSLRGERQALL